MSQATNSPNDKKTASFSFQPPAGGDLTLKSSDGVTFVVHSVLLCIASKVFAGMFEASKVADIIDLTEDAEAISLMLAFIYPTIRPQINTIPRIEKSILVANKYDIPVIEQTLNEIVPSLHDVIRDDPLRLFHTAKNHGFRKIQTTAARLVLPGNQSMTTVEALVKYAKEYPEWASIIGVIGAQAIRVQLLNEIGLAPSYIWPSAKCFGNAAAGADITCRKCARYDYCYSTTISQRVRPGWLGAWATGLRTALESRTLDESLCWFELGILETLGSCSECVQQTFAKRNLFKDWAKETLEVIRSKLDPLEVLYTL
ncbi:The BTB (BR-C, ttk and bab)/POZ (Pox virus and Zinc finger) domain [Ceratobasidium sp. AG-Ba]|nr:The BTB (BR-C, ttk and bab)/POZ (Pox virus and Zinc finger) domain [Ceratobasidium sp. AG-Ba]